MLLLGVMKPLFQMIVASLILVGLIGEVSAGDRERQPSPAVLVAPVRIQLLTSSNSFPFIHAKDSLADHIIHLVGGIPYPIRPGLTLTTGTGLWFRVSF